jgi:hypothetical protein
VIANSSAELIALYGATATAEIQRLRINAGRYVSFNVGIGYVQHNGKPALRDLLRSAVGRKLARIGLHEVYGYNGANKLKILTE